MCRQPLPVADFSHFATVAEFPGPQSSAPARLVWSDLILEDVTILADRARD